MPIMQTFSSRDAQNNWGTVTDIAKKEPVTVTQYGRASFMLVPVEIGQEAVRLHTAARFAEFMKTMPPPKSGAPEISDEEVNRLVHELRP